MIRYTKDTDHIVTLTLDMQNRQRNLLNHEIIAAFLPVLSHLKKEKENGTVKGVIITSSKSNFLVGGDLKYLSQIERPQDVFDYSEKLKSFFRELEKPGVPVVAAINGNAIGTGFEMALACHHRIVLNNENVKIGLSEAKYGVMPGNGGVIRLMWLLGIEKAFHILTEGKEWTPMEALNVQLIDELAESKEEMLRKAKAWLLAAKETMRPWDIPNSSIPGGTAKNADTAQKIAQLAAYVSAKWRNNYPAPQAILNTLAEGSQVDFETACRIESRYYTSLLLSKESRNMTEALWFDQNQILNGQSRPKGFGKFRPRKIGIVGAGVMGSGIATACVAAGHSVVLKDVSKMIAENGKERVGKMLDTFIESGRLPSSIKSKSLKKLTTTETADGFKDCDLVIESVFENANLKRKVVTETEQYLDEYSILATNTVSIPITQLAKSSSNPEKLIGLHFLKPAEEKLMVEIVRGEKTSEDTVAKAFDFVKSIGRTPIVVKDDWGFYVARVQNTFILEGITMLQEGISPAIIENLGLQCGMPKPPLALADELSFQLVLKYEKQAADHYGGKYAQHPAVEVLNKMMGDLGRQDRGFYQKENGEIRLWSKLSQHFPTKDNTTNYSEIMERFLFAQVIEAVWCLQEKVISSKQEANLGSVLGWGFPSFKGGVMQYIQDYGKQAFMDTCEQLKKEHGQRFAAPKWLKENI